jgi:hypothetical protein
MPEHAFTIHMKAKKGYQKGILVGQCIEYPAIIVQGKTLLDIKKEIFDGLEGYFKAFPEKLQPAIEKYAALVQDQEQREQIDRKIQKQEEILLMNEDQIGDDWQELELLAVQH